MRRLAVLIERLKAFEASINNIIEASIKANHDAIIDLNVNNQLYERGVDRDGIEIHTYAPYSQLTVALKKAKNQNSMLVTLRDEGDFHQSFTLLFIPGGFKIIASDWKTDRLISKYGEQILGLTNENAFLVAYKFIIPAIVGELKRI